MERRPIPGFPGYEITEDGRVFSWLITKSNHKPRTVARELKPRNNSNGYLQVDLRKEGKQLSKLVHRLVLEAFVGIPPSPDMNQACHCDGNRLNNHISNLRWDSRAGNEADKKLHGTSYNGSRHVQAKLTEHLVLQIRALYKAGGISQQQLANQFGVMQPLISRIVNRKIWTHI